MRRRSFLKAAAAVSGAAAVSAQAAPAISSNKKVLTMFATDPNGKWPSSQVIGENAYRLFDWIETATDGDVVLQPYLGEDEIPEDAEYEYVMDGRLDGYCHLEYHWNRVNQAFRMFGGGMPMGLLHEEISAWVYHGGGEALWDELSASYGVKTILAGTIGVQMIGWFAKEIHSGDDVKGTIMHMPGFAGTLMRSYGAITQDFPNSLLLDGLRDGRLAAVEKASPYIDLGYRFHEAAKYYYSSAFHEPGGTVALGFNQKIWESFTSREQRIIKETCMAHNAYSAAQAKARNAEAFRILTEEHAVERRLLPEDMVIRAGELAGELVRSIEEQSELGKRIADSHRRFRKTAMAWTDASVVGFSTNRNLPYPY